MTHNETDHLDVLIVGAGLSGIGAAHQLKANFPAKSFAIFEARDAIGGTWDLFRYPGIRSDSDMQTLGYRFRPWTGDKALADGPAILEYVRDTARESGVDRHIRFGHRVTGAVWSTADARWTVHAVRDDGESVTVTCSFLYVCSGYYSYDEGYTPHFEGTDRFEGQIVHPQHWPDDLDYTGKQVVVIGSGATAATLVPAMTDKAAHVTMLQRSPSYVLSIPGKDPLANGLRRVVGDEAAYAIARWKNVALMTAFYQLSQRRPSLVKAAIRAALKPQLPAGYDIDTHFNPSYRPWDQRPCVVPDGDFFRAIRRGRASIVTDRIATFTERGIELESGTELEADLIITATGLRLVVCGGIELAVDGRAVSFPETMVYRGMMFGDVPNFAFVIGYTNASWTLKADLVTEYVCRLLAHMDEHGYATCTPVNDDPTIQARPLLDFGAGYVQRSLHELPKAGSKHPWRLSMTYPQDLVRLRHGRIEDGVMRFSRGGAGARAPGCEARAA